MPELPIGRETLDRGPLSEINISDLQEDPQDLRDGPVSKALKCATAISLLYVGFFSANKFYEYFSPEAKIVILQFGLPISAGFCVGAVKCYDLQTRGEER